MGVAKCSKRNGQLESLEDRTPHSARSGTGPSRQDGKLPRVFEILDFVYVSFGRLVPYDRIGLALVDNDGATIRQVWQRTDDPGMLLPTNYRGYLAEGTLGQVIASGRPRILNDLEEYLREHPNSIATRALVRVGIRSSLTCPLQVEGRPFGVLFFSSREVATYTDVHVTLFKEIANDVALLLDPNFDPKARFGEVLGRLALQLDGAFRQQQLLTELSAHIHKGHHFGEVMDRVFEGFGSILPFDRIGVALLEENGTVVRAHWARSRAAQMLLGEGCSFPLENTSLGAVLKSGCPRIINDLTAYLEAHPHSAATRLMVKEGMRSSLTCPLLNQCEPMGFIFFSSAVPDTYRSGHVAAYQRIASVVATAIVRSLRMDTLEAESGFSASLLAEMMPQKVLSALRRGRSTIAEYVHDAGVMFVDIVDYTSFSHHVDPQRLVQALGGLFGEFDRICEMFRVYKLRTIGDSYVMVSGVTEDNDPYHLERLVEAGLRMTKVATRWSDPLGRSRHIRVHAGAHVGGVVAGVLGGRVPHYDVWGPTVNLASRLEGVADAGDLCVTAATAERLGSRFACSRLGPIDLKGFGSIDVYRVDAPRETWPASQVANGSLPHSGDAGVCQDTPEEAHPESR